MKKLMFTFAMVAMAFTTVQAQKQLGGEHNFEVAFNPFGGNPINASTLKYRNFLDDDAAIRVTLGLNNSSNKYLAVPENSLGQVGAANETHPDLYLTNDHSSFEIGVGYEKHFRGTDNLSPYIAFAASYGSSSFTLKRDHYSAVNIDGSTVDQAFWEDEPDPAQWGVWDYQNQVKSSTINVDLLFGADYYFNDAIYVGFEAGLRFSQTSGISSTITTSNNKAFNMYFDGGFGDENTSQFVQNTATESGYQWSTNQEVNYVINGEPWDASENAGVYSAVDNLWNTWNDQSPENFDTASDFPRDAYFNGTNFLGTYSTGMLRVGFLFE